MPTLVSVLQVQDHRIHTRKEELHSQLWETNQEHSSKQCSRLKDNREMETLSDTELVSVVKSGDDSEAAIAGPDCTLPLGRSTGGGGVFREGKKTTSVRFSHWISLQSVLAGEGQHHQQEAQQNLKFSTSRHSANSSHQVSHAGIKDQRPNVKVSIRSSSKDSGLNVYLYSHFQGNARIGVRLGDSGVLGLEVKSFIFYSQVCH